VYLNKRAFFISILGQVKRNRYNATSYYIAHSFSYIITNYISLLPVQKVDQKYIYAI